MAKIKLIELNNFRNFQHLKLPFEKKTNIFYGNNGSGKTNILESISLFAKGRGIRNSNISNLIKSKSDFFNIKGIVDINNNNYDLQISSEKNENRFKKKIKINNDSTNESINFLNKSLSLLIFLPEMERLFQSSPSYRRNFIDRLIFSELDNYNTLINKYKKNVTERTKILQQNNSDLDWINVIEAELSKIGLQVYRLREQKIIQLNNHIKYLNRANDYRFNISFKIEDNFYNSELNNDTYTLTLKSVRNYDKKFGGTKIGPHKSDIIAKINDGFDASQLSTGQQKTIVLIMLLAQCDILISKKNIKPILLLDEICSHLDSNNRKILLDMINKFDIQFFLTGTEKTLFSFISTNTDFYNITNI